MKKLFVEKSIDINAPAYKVWEVITKEEHTAQWALEFSGGEPKLFIHSNWNLGSSVFWKDENGTVIVEGNVTAFEKNILLRYTVFDARSPERPAVTDEDGITFQLSEENNGIILAVKQGDFSCMTDGEKFRDASAGIWDRVLPRIKALAEI